MPVEAGRLSEVDAWLAQLTAATRRLDAGTTAAVLAAYADVSDWNNPAETLAAAIAAAAAARAGQQAAAGTTAQFIANVVGILAGSTVSAAPATPSTYPRAADPFDVYSRPIFAYRDAVASGSDHGEAQAAAFQRAEMIALTDNILARRDAALAEAVRSGGAANVEVIRYRRVIRPELSETGTCGLCIAAATRVYKIHDLMPMHSRCKCEVMPIVGSQDPGHLFNAGDLEDLYSTIPATKRADLSKFRYRVHQDPELGPLLVPADGGTVPRAA